MSHDDPRRAIGPAGIGLCLLAAACTFTVAMIIAVFVMAEATEAIAVRYVLPWVVVLYFANGIVVATVVGLPAFLVLRSMHLVRWWSAALAGAAIGLVFAWRMDTDIKSTGAMVAVGMVSALAFWIAWAKITASVHAT